MIAGIAGMIAGIAGMIAGIAGMIAGMIAGIIETEKCKRAFATGLIGDRKMLVIAGVSIPTTPAITGKATLRTAKGFAEDMFRGTASTPAIGDGSQPGAWANKKAAGV
jgi:hypothetical protein